MATWTFHGYPSGALGGATASAAGVVSMSDTDSALVFGGGSRGDFAENITLNSWNTSMHWGSNSTITATDCCPADHLWPLTPITDGPALTRATAAYLDGDYKRIQTSTAGENLEVASSHGIGMRFRHDFAVRCNPVQIWAGTADGASEHPLNAYVAICELSCNTATWDTVDPNNKLALRGHLDASADHWWSVGIAVCPHTVGHFGGNVVKIETTYY